MIIFDFQDHMIQLLIPGWKRRGTMGMLSISIVFDALELVSISSMFAIG